MNTQKVTYRIFAAAALLLLFTVQSCRDKDDPEPANGNNSDSELPPPTPYELELPPYFPEPQIPEDNPLTLEGVKLGQKLYYDRDLSKGGPQAGNACASCHLQEYGFTVPGTNILPHINLAWNKHFLWNGKVSGTLEDIMRFEVEDFFEVNIDNLNEHPEYPALFKQVYEVDEIEAEHVAYALAQFFRTLISGDSEYDRYANYGESLDADALNGFRLFNSESADCFHCHQPPLFTDRGMHNIGLSAEFTGEDRGHYVISGDQNDMGFFKTPTLRNVALRPPYMHDGRFETLEEVVEFYRSGVQYSATLDPVMQKPNRDEDGKLPLSDEDVKDIVAFLKTLTDQSFLENPALSEPK